MLSPHSFPSINNACVIQLTYEPEGKPAAFNLRTVTVLSGRLNVGVKSASGAISVYYLTGPGLWSLPSADNLVRATLELPSEAAGARFYVDDIVFEPAQ